MTGIITHRVILLHLRDWAWLVAYTSWLC